MKISEIQMKLYENLKDSGWGNKLRMFILSDEFAYILKVLYSNSKSGKRFTPVLKEIFRMMQECPYNELKVVIVGQDPYPQAGAADGIAFSCRPTEKIQPSLKAMFKDIEKTVYPDGMKWDTDLSRWSKQGVLMLNTSLTCEIGNPGSHEELWKPFMRNLFDMLNTYNTGLCYVYMGQKAREWHKSISSNNYKFFTTHPAAAGYNGGVWDSGDLWNNINRVMEQMYGQKINW